MVEKSTTCADRIAITNRIRELREAHKLAWPSKKERLILARLEMQLEWLNKRGR
jgi:hypothetical protein